MADDQNYVWTDSYRSALLETDPAKLRELLSAADQVLQKRERELLADTNHNRAELQALTDAMRNLRVLKKELKS